MRSTPERGSVDKIDSDTLFDSCLLFRLCHCERRAGAKPSLNLEEIASAEEHCLATLAPHASAGEQIEGQV